VAKLSRLWRIARILPDIDPRVSRVSYRSFVMTVLSVCRAVEPETDAAAVAHLSPLATVTAERRTGQAEDRRTAYRAGSGSPRKVIIIWVPVRAVLRALELTSGANGLAR
jgi:hypothetical protein